MMTGDTYTVRDAARLLGISQETIRRMIVRGDLPAGREPSPGHYGWRYRIPAAAVQALMRERGRG